MNSAMWLAASTISVRYRVSCRIQEPRLFEHGSSDQRLQSVLRYQIHLAPEQVREIQHQAGVVHQIDAGIRKELDQHVDVAVGPHLSAGGGPKQREFPDAVLPAQIRQVGLVHLVISYAVFCLKKK